MYIQVKPKWVSFCKIKPATHTDLIEFEFNSKERVKFEEQYVPVTVTVC